MSIGDEQRAALRQIMSKIDSGTNYAWTTGYPFPFPAVSIPNNWDWTRRQQARSGPSYAQPAASPLAKWLLWTISSRKVAYRLLYGTLKCRLWTTPG